MDLEFSYTSALDEMEAIMSQIENEDVDVDKLSEKVKRMSVLIKECKNKLKETEEEVHNVIDDLMD